MSGTADRVAELEKQLKAAQESNKSLKAQLTGRETMEAETKERVEAAKGIEQEVQALRAKGGLSVGAEERRVLFR